MKLLPQDLTVVYRDAHLLVLDKPPTIATTSPNNEPSLFALAQALDPRAEQLHPLSRLDTQVSGLVAFARTKRANEVALEARRNGTMHRRYLALCTVTPSPAEGDWTWSIALDPRDARKRRALDPGESGVGVKHASTHYLAFASAGPLCALHLWPRTGRTHQLRVHAARAGSSLAGDVAYGGLKRMTLPNGRVLTAARVMLHCASLRMPVPSSEGLALDLHPPEDFRALWTSASGDEASLLARPPE